MAVKHPRPPTHHNLRSVVRSSMHRAGNPDHRADDPEGLQGPRSKAGSNALKGLSQAFTTRRMRRVLLHARWCLFETRLKEKPLRKPPSGNGNVAVSTCRIRPAHHPARRPSAPIAAPRHAGVPPALRSPAAVGSACATGRMRRAVERVFAQASTKIGVVPTRVIDRTAQRRQCPGRVTTGVQIDLRQRRGRQ